MTKADRGREAPMVISPWRLVRLLVATARYLRENLRKKGRADHGS